MRSRQRRSHLLPGILGVVDKNVIVAPQIRRTNVAAEIEFVQRAVELVRTPLGHHLHLAASGSVKVGRLAGSANLELFDTFNRRWNHARGSSARGIGTGVAIARRVGGVATRHVVAIVPAVELEFILIGRRPSDVSCKGDTDLQDCQGGCIAAEVGQ